MINGQKAKLTNEQLLELFMQKVYPEPNTGCWLWGGKANYNGYGQFKHSELPFKAKMAHRASYWLHYGPFDYNSLHVCHKCDVTFCVNPDHLFLGTHMDNVRDKVAKGRQGRIGPRGLKSGTVKISEENVRDIRALSGKMKQKEIGALYGLSQASISFIVNKINWKYLHD